MARHIFVNYRRALSQKDAQLLHTRLQRQFGSQGVFLDVSGLDGGDHWLHTLERQVDASAAMVALIGPGWADILSEHGQRRLDNPNDFVRFELARAFSRAIPVLPVLIDSAEMPDIAKLPTNLVPLTFPQAMLLRSASFDDDADKIGKRLKVLIAQARPRGVSWRKASAVAAFALAAGVAVPIVATQLRLAVPGLAGPYPDPVLVARLERAEVSIKREQAAGAKLIEDAQAAEERYNQALAADRARSDQRVAAAEAAQKAATDEALRATSARDVARKEAGDRRDRLSAAETALKAVQETADKLDAETKIALARIVAITTERDAVRATLMATTTKSVDLAKQLEALGKDADAARARIVAITKERDDSRAALAAAINKNDDIAKRVASLSKDADAERSRIGTVAKERDDARTALAAATTKNFELTKEVAALLNADAPLADPGDVDCKEQIPAMPFSFEREVYNLPWLRMSLISKECFATLGLSVNLNAQLGLAIESIVPKSDAAAKGLKVGDEILGISGVEASTVVVLSDAIATQKAARRPAIQLKVRSDGATRFVAVRFMR